MRIRAFSLITWVRIVSLASLTFLIVGLTLTNYLSQHRLLREFEEDHEKPAEDARLIRWKIEVHLERLEQELMRLAKVDDLKEAAAKTNRNALLDQLQPPLNRLRRSPLRVERINFYLPSGELFLRAHDPTLSADRVPSFRPLIAETAKNRRIVRGIEAEGNTFFLWAAAPLYEKGRVMGVIEIGTPISVFLQEVKSQLGADTGLFVQRESSKPKLVTLEATERTRFDMVSRLFDFPEAVTAPTRRVVRAGGQTFAISLIPISNFSKRHGLVLAVLFDVTRFTQLLNRNTVNLLGVSACGFLIAAILIIFLTRRLEKARRSLESKTAELAISNERQLRQADVLRERERTEEEIQRSLKRIQALHEIDLAITSSLDLQDVLRVLLEKIDLFLPYHSSATVRLHKKNGKNGSSLEPVACRNLDEREWRLEQWKAGRGPANEVFETKTPIMIRNCCADLRVLDPDFFRKHALISYLGTPLIAKERILGVLSLYTKEEHEFTREEIEFVSTLAGQAAIAIHNSELYEQLKEKLQDLQQKTSELERANKGKDEFLSVISHELRTPVNVIIGYTRIMNEKILGEINAEQKSALGKIMRHSMDLLSMINSILQVTRIDAEAVEAEIREVNLGNFLDEFKSNYDFSMDKEVIINWDYPSDLPVVNTDDEKLKHVLQNLVSNAMKFTENGTVTISVQYVHDLLAVQFTVIDTGIGIPKESVPVIFDRFRQLDSSQTRTYGGVGIGLYLVKKFTQMLGGYVEMESAVGKGSTFTVTIPCVFSPSSMSPAKENKALESSTRQEAIQVSPSASNIQRESLEER